MTTDLETLRARDQLLIRTYSGINFIPTPMGMMTPMPQMEKEIKAMAASGLDNLSTTLLPTGTAAGVYSAGGKTVGLLLDANKVTPTHIAADDSNSHTRDDGTLSAQGTGMQSLNELADNARLTNSKKVNEVNINSCHLDACVGFASLGSPLSQVEAAAAQKFFLSETGKILPVVEYDQKTGAMTPLTEDILQTAPKKLATQGYDSEYVEAARTAMGREAVSLAKAKQAATETIKPLSNITSTASPEKPAINVSPSRSHLGKS